jgi:uncharacterized OB-fold protein
MTLESIRIARDRAYPPRVSAFTRPFWEGLAQGVWQTSFCGSCRKFTFPPKPICPHCWSDQMIWQPLTPLGTLYAWTRVHAAPRVFQDETPYTLGIIDLDAGVRIAARLIDQDETDPACEDRVRIVVLAYDDGPLFAAVRHDVPAEFP